MEHSNLSAIMLTYSWSSMNGISHKQPIWKPLLEGQGQNIDFCVNTAYESLG